MKLSKSKLALAKAINENGGWFGDAENAAQDRDGDVYFYSGTPSRVTGREWWSADGLIAGSRIRHDDAAIKNWHQTILSREEYYQAYPKTDADGWIEWNGGECPVYGDDEVDVVLVGGSTDHGIADEFDWHRDGGPLSVASYRLHKPEVKPEFCESVMRSIPDPESKPTIEQLVADYRNAKDYALRLQEEANDAWTAAEKAKGELIDAGKALGLVLSVAEPELVIADWRDLRVNDVIFVGEYDDCESGEYVVIELEGIDYGYDYAVKAAGMDGNGRWIDTTKEWRFIRRP